MEIRTLSSRALATLFSAAILMTPAFADPTVDADDAPSTASEPAASFFATTTVTATGSEADTHELATPVFVITNPNERSPDNAADLLRDQPGVDVNGVGPNQARPVIRGQRGLRVLFLENGLRMNNARRQSDFGELPGLIPLEGVDRVEVVRGPASVLYGSDAIGGVLNLITAVPRDGQGFSFDLGLRYSTADEQQKANAAFSGRSGKFSYALGATWRDARNYDAPAGSFGNIILNDTTEVLDSGVEDDSVRAYLGYRPFDEHAFFLRFNRYRADSTGFGFVDAPGAVDEEFRIRILYPFQNFDKVTLGYQGSQLGSPIIDSIDFQAYFQNNERQLVNDIDINIGPIFPGAPDSTVASDTRNFTDLETFGFRSEVIKAAGGSHVLTYGAEFFQDESRNTDFSRTVTTIRFPFPPFARATTTTDAIANAPNARNTSYGVFVQDELRLGDRFKAIVGTRYQNVETTAKATPGWNISGLDFEDDNVVGAVNLLFALTDEINLVGSWGTAFRAPNIIERLFNGATPEGNGFQILNPDLVSEESENFDLGFKFQNRRAFFEAFYFENEIDNGVIQYFLSTAEAAALPAAVRDQIRLSGARFVVQQRNLDVIEYDGWELSGGYRFDFGLSVNANYSHLEGIRLSGSLPLPTSDSYSDKWNLRLRFDPSDAPYLLEYRARHNGDEGIALTPGEPPPLVGTTLPDFTVHSLFGSYAFELAGQKHTIGVLVDNLTDELYAEFSNATFFRPQAERNIVLSYNVSF